MNRIIALVVFLAAALVGYNLYDNFDPDVIQGKRVVVTGASAGIGEQMAYHYAKLGARILITARREARLKEVIEKCRLVGDPEGDYHYVSADMSVAADAQKVIDTAKTVLGGIDYLVLNHIIPIPLGDWQGSAENHTRLDLLFDVNFKAYVRLTSAALGPLEESKGSIVVVSSIAGRISQPYIITYSATKFALDGFFSGLRQEFTLKKKDISVTLCIIGLVGTESALQNLQDFGLGTLLKTIPIGEPSEAAMAIIRGGAERVREVYYPYMEARFSTLLRNWIPSILESIMAAVYEKS